MFGVDGRRRYVMCLHGMSGIEWRQSLQGSFGMDLEFTVSKSVLVNTLALLPYSILNIS